MIETFFQLILLYHNLIKKINSSNKRNLKKIIDKVLINNKNKYDFISLIIIINNDFNDEIIKDYFKEIKNISIIIISVNNENIFQKNSINNNYNVHFINFNEYKTNNLDENKLSNLLLEIVSNDLINYNIIKNEI